MPDLTKIITPTLLAKINATHFPFPKSEPLDFAAVGRLYFRNDPPQQSQLHSLCYDTVLKPLSSIGVANISTENLLTCLPPPTDPTYPEQALGLILLLDQIPRNLLTGVDARYIYSYFDILSRLLFKSILDTVPVHLRPWRLERWNDNSWPFEHAITRQIFFFAPMIHSEDVDDQALSMGFIEEMRVATEIHTKTTDPNRLTRGEDLKDVFLFPRLIRAGPPSPPLEGSGLEEYVFWSGRVMDSHVPIIRRFGRYPRWVRQQGNVYTEEERRYMEETAGFGTAGFSDEDAESVRRDVVGGVWSVLGGAQGKDEWWGSGLSD